MSLLILHVIHSLIGYILIVQIFNYATWSLFPEHHFRRWAKLTSIFLVIAFALNNKLDFEFVSYSWSQEHFAPSFLWLDVIVDRLHLHETSRQMCRDHHEHSELFQDINWIHDEKYHPCPRWFVLSSTTLLPSLQPKLVHVLGYTLTSLLSNICPSLAWSVTIFYLKNVVRISPPLKKFLV